MKIILTTLLLISIFTLAHTESRAQYAIGVSAIAVTPFAVDTYSETSLDPVLFDYYNPYVAGYLYKISRYGFVEEYRSGSAYCGECPTAYGYMSAPTIVDNLYQLESDHYLVSFYYAEDPPLTFWYNPYGYGYASESDPFLPTGYQFLPGSQPQWQEIQFDYLGTTAVAIQTFLPQIQRITPPHAPVGGSGYFLVTGQTLRGPAGFGDVTANTSKPGVTVHVDSANDTQAQVSFSISPNAAKGSTYLELSNYWGSSSLEPVSLLNAYFTIYDFTVTQDKQDSVVVPTGIVAGLNGADPPIPEADTRATVTVQTDPPVPDANFTLEAQWIREADESITGHFLQYHTGNRPVGTLNPASGSTDQNGKFTSTYTAPIFAGTDKLTARTNILGSIGSLGNVTRETTVGIALQEVFSLLTPGANYVLTGSVLSDGTAPHRDNHYGTAIAVTNLPLIADDYIAAFPGADLLRYNDMSLREGGKFETAGDWGNGAHQEHRVGRNCDVRMSDVPAANQPMLLQIFITRRVQDPHPEPTLNHWHLRFSTTP